MNNIPAKVEFNYDQSSLHDKYKCYFHALETSYEFNPYSALLVTFNIAIIPDFELVSGEKTGYAALLGATGAVADIHSAIRARGWTPTEIQYTIEEEYLGRISAKIEATVRIGHGN